MIKAVARAVTAMILALYGLSVSVVSSQLAVAACAIRQSLGQSVSA